MKPKRTKLKSFKVASVSSNTNSFGLRGMVLVAADGEAWEIGANSLNVRPKGTVLEVPTVGKSGRNFARYGFEIPRKLPAAPPVVILQVWV